MRDGTAAPRQDPTRTFLRVWAALILILTVVPYFIARARTPPGFRYDWLISPYPADGFAYKAWARQAYDGFWLFSLKFTAQRNPRVIFLPFFLLAGKLARLTGADVGVIFLVLKCVGVALFFRALYDFLEHLKFTPFQSVAAAVLVGISAGIGAFSPKIFGPLPLNWTPVDLWVVDSNTFWSLLWNPLYPYSLTLMLLAARYADESSVTGDARAAWLCGLCLGAEALLHPYPLAVLHPLTAALFIARRPRGWAALWMRVLAASLPAALYVAGVAVFDSAIRTHNLLGSQDSVTAFAALSGLGLPLALAAAGLAARPRDFARRYWPLLLWISLSAALTLSPIWFPAKHLFGVHLPICLLAAAASQPLLERLPRAGRIAAIAAFAVFLPWTNILHLRDCVADAAANAEGSYLISPDRQDALRYLEEHSRRSDVVFADLLSSAQICAYVGDTVLWGHWAQGIDFTRRQDWMARVFSPASGLSSQERRSAFWGQDIAFAFLSGRWRDGLETAADPAVLAGAEKVFENATVTIYRRPAGMPFLNSTSQASKSDSRAGSPTSRR